MHRVGHDHAGHLVPHEQGVAVADQRPDAGDDRDAQRLDFVEHPQQGVGIEDRLGDGELGPLLDLLAEAIQLAAAVQGRGVQPDADHRQRLRVDGLAAQVDAAVQPPLHGDHADRVGVEHAGGVRDNRPAWADRR